MKAHPPERCGPDLVRRRMELRKYRALQVGMFGNSSSVMFGDGLHYAVASAHVMQEKITVRMKCLVPQRGGNCEIAAVDDGSRGRCRKRRDVTADAANFVENLFAMLSASALRKRDVARRRFQIGRAH